MSVTNKRWDGQTITPKHDSIQFDNGQNGIIHGCEITHLGSNILRIAEGYMIICGRLIEVDQTDINCEVSSSGTLNGQMIIRLNLGAVQSIEILTEAAGELTELTQDADANYDNGIYEIQLATYNVNETTISNLEVTAPTIDKLGDKVAAVESDIDELNQNLNNFSFRKEDGKKQVSTDGGQTWENFSSGEEPTLLWTNSSPTSAFPAQTISLDLTDYDGILIEYRRYTSNPTITSRCYINKGETLYGAGLSTYPAAMVRKTTVNNNNVVFDSGIESAITNNNGAIPTRIWGVKGVFIPTLSNHKRFNVNTSPYTETFPSKASTKVIVQFHASAEGGGLVVFTYDVDTRQTTYSSGATRDASASGYASYIQITDENVTITPPNAAWMGDIWDYFYA